MPPGETGSRDRASRSLIAHRRSEGACRSDCAPGAACGVDGRIELKIYDISMPISDRTPVWPGDTPYRYQLNATIGQGAAVNLGQIEATVHLGSHADAPLHFAPDGPAIDEVDLSAYIGPAVLIDLSDQDSIGVDDLRIEGMTETPRLLIRTSAWKDRAQFPDSFPVIEPEVAGFLQQSGAVLLGIDVPSVDRFDSKDLPNHHALELAGIRILESLALDGVPEGRYELIALPLRLEGADGSPVRAALRTIPPD